MGARRVTTTVTTVTTPHSAPVGWVDAAEGLSTRSWRGPPPAQPLTDGAFGRQVRRALDVQSRSRDAPGAIVGPRGCQHGPSRYFPTAAHIRAACACEDFSPAR